MFYNCESWKSAYDKQPYDIVHQMMEGDDVDEGSHRAVVENWMNFVIEVCS